MKIKHLGNTVGGYKYKISKKDFDSEDFNPKRF